MNKLIVFLVRKHPQSQKVHIVCGNRHFMKNMTTWIKSLN